MIIIIEEILIKGNIINYKWNDNIIIIKYICMKEVNF